MTRTDVAEKIVEAIEQIQTLSGEAGPPITDTTCPAEELAYDSLRTAEACVYVSEALGCDYTQTLNLFAPTPELPVVRVSDIITRACALLGTNCDE